AALIEIILKVEEFRKQGRPAEVVIKDSFGRLMKEKMELSIRQMRAQMVSSASESEQIELTGRILALRRLQESDLLAAETLDEIYDLKQKIDEIIGD
ncbi:MAG: hypothetical protein IAF58_11765, partial [Leptolyngbya sp.]|nr:hypothetical protein [Candidatus Melainabacteria bacterium]